MKITTRSRKWLAALSLAPLLTLMPAVPGMAARPATISNWPVYGYDAAHSGYNPTETAFTPQNVRHLKLAWSYPLIGYSQSTIGVTGVSEAGVFYGTNVVSGTVFALDMNTGKTLWTSHTGYSNPQMDGPHKLIMVSGDALVKVAVPGGKLVWTVPFTTGAPSFVVPWHGVDYVQTITSRGTQSQVVAVDDITGEVKWTITTTTLLWPVSIAGANVYLTFPGNGGVYDIQAYNLSTGKPAWRCSDHASGCVAFTISTKQHLLYCSCGNLVALDLTTGAVKWTAAPPTDRGFGGMMSTDGSRVVISLAKGVVRHNRLALGAYDAATGKFLWQSSLVASNTRDSKPVIASGMVFMDWVPNPGSYNAPTLIAYNLKTGARLWTYKGAANTFGADAMVADGKLIVAIADRFLAFAPK